MKIADKFHKKALETKYQHYASSAFIFLKAFYFPSLHKVGFQIFLNIPAVITPGIGGTDFCTSHTVDAQTLIHRISLLINGCCGTFLHACLTPVAFLSIPEFCHRFHLFWFRFSGPGKFYLFMKIFFQTFFHCHSKSTELLYI